MARFLVTGAAGFIGMHTTEALLARGDEVVGVDSLNDYYDPALKQARLARLQGRPGFRFAQLDLADRAATEALFADGRWDGVVHLAAQAGVRWSLTHPHAYITANHVAFLHVLEGCRHAAVPHLVYASSSSVYGLNNRLPFSTADRVDHPISLYAATKKSNELTAHAYSHLYGIPTTGLRFFTVYGPWGRPDMAMWIFSERILKGEPIELFNEGRMRRDFTYVDDIVRGVIGVLDRPPVPQPDWRVETGSPSTSSAPYRIFNIGNHSPVELGHLIGVLERELGRPAQRVLRPMQPGDVAATFADVADLQALTGFAPETPIEVGAERFVRWFRQWVSRA